MANGTIEQNATRVLAFLYEQPRDLNHGQFGGPDIAKGVGLEADEVNDAVTILEENGYVEWMRTLGTAPFEFHSAAITPRGRFELQRARAEAAKTPTTAEGDIAQSSAVPQGVTAVGLPVVPSGSPFGFTEQDWEAVASARGAVDRLNVVFGFQFESEHYNASQLRDNVEAMLRHAVRAYRELPTALPITLAFLPLAAGYGEHLFNKIASDIIGADVAVFDTSDQNPNVMIEMGVALTWGVRVLPIHHTKCSPPPSDISGQTWATYEEDGARFLNPDHQENLLRLVQRAAQRKSRLGS